MPDSRMKIAFADISNAGNRYEIQDDAWFPEPDLQRIGPVRAELSLNRKGDSRVEVCGELHTQVRLACDRCLADYPYAVDVDFHLVLEVPSAATWQIKELECSSADLDTILLQEPVVDFGDILRQQLYLSLPDKLICTAACKGLCPKCGRDLNTGVCSCEVETKESPFAVLAKLKTD
jgi:uncharacterized protein